MIRAVLHKEIIMGATRSAAGVLKYPLVVNWKETGGTILVDGTIFVIPPRTTTQIRTGTGPSAPPIITRSQNIEGPRRSIIPHVVSNANPLDTSINIIPAKHRDPTPSWSKLIDSITITN